MSLYFDFDTPDDPDYLGLCNNADSEPVAVLKLVKRSERILDSWGTSDIARYNEKQAFTLPELVGFSGENPSLKDICKPAFDELAYATINRIDLGESQSDVTEYGLEFIRPSMG